MTLTATGVKLQAFLEAAPVVGLPIDPTTGQPSELVVHAVTAGNLMRAWPRGPMVAACGLPGVRLVAADGVPAQFPPKATASGGWSVCTECKHMTRRAIFRAGRRGRI